MKVSVAFGEKRVVVPCRDGTLTIRELVEEASRRYRKANSMKPDVSSPFSGLLVETGDITVYRLESREGAIFDMDDRVCDVADDKETLIAVFHEGPHSGLSGGGVGGGGDCASSGDGGNSSEHFTTHDTHSDIQPHHHLNSEVSRAKSEEFLSRSSVPLLDEIESSLGAKNNYNYNYSNYRNSAKTSSPKFKPNSSYEHGYPGPGLNMGSSSPDLLTGNTNDLNSDKPVMKSADFVDTESNRSSSPENFEKSSRQSSVREKAKGGIANSRSHTDGDLKLLSGNGETYQSSADGRNSRPPKPQQQMFRRGTFGTEASPRQTASSNSEMIDRWMTKHIMKQNLDDSTDPRNPKRPESPPFVSPQLNLSYYSSTAADITKQKEQDIRSKSQNNSKSTSNNNANSSKLSEKELSEASESGNAQSSEQSEEKKLQQKVFTSPATVSNSANGNVGQRFVSIVNDESPLGIQVVAQYEKKRQLPVNKSGVVTNQEVRSAAAGENVAVGLLVRQVNEGGKAHAQSILSSGDLITEINGASLYGLTFEAAQNVFKNALQTPSLTLRIVTNQTVTTTGSSSNSLSVPNRSSLLNNPLSPANLSSTSISITPMSSSTEPPVTGDGDVRGQNRYFFPSPDRRQLQGNDSTAHTSLQQPALKGNSSNPSLPQSNSGYNLSAGPVSSSTLPRSSQHNRRKQQQQLNASEAGGVARQDVSTPPADSGGNRTFNFDSPLSLMGRANTKKIGRKIKVQLNKGPDGLGFSLTERDNSGPSNANSPVYIKSILAKGAAIKDGRLQEGDRILEVNGTAVGGMSQSQVVSLLRAIPQGHMADILVSRQESEDMPREIQHPPGEVKKPKRYPLNYMTSSEGRSSSPAHHHLTESSLTDDPTIKRTVLNFIIPLNDTGSAGLGISVKGRAQKDLSTGVSSDTGVFVKNVINGGAAWKDGRLKVHDQLLSVNGESLMGMDNKEAIDLLKTALIQHGKSGQASLRITVLRLESTVTSDSLPPPHTQMTESYPGTQTHATQSVFDVEDRLNTSNSESNNNLQVVDEADKSLEGAFSREDKHRRSLSEKRTAGGKTRDANELAFYREKIKPLKDAATGSQSNLPKSRLSRSNSYDYLSDPLVNPKDRGAMTLNRKRSAGEFHQQLSVKGAGVNNSANWTNFASSGGANRSAKWHHDFYRNHNRIRYYTAKATPTPGQLSKAKSASLESMGRIVQQNHYPNNYYRNPNRATAGHFNQQQFSQGANQYYANSQEVQSYEQHQQPRRPSDSNNSTDNNYYNGMGALNIPPPVPARRVKPPLGTVSGVQQPSNNDQTRTGADEGNGSMARTFGDPTMASKENSKKSKTGTGIFRGLFSPPPPSYDGGRNASQSGSRDRSGLGGGGHRYRSPNRPSRPPPTSATPRSHKKQEKNSMSVTASGGPVVSGNRSASAPLRPQSTMPLQAYKIPPSNAQQPIHHQQIVDSTANAQQHQYSQLHNRQQQFQQQQQNQLFAHHNLNTATASGDPAITQHPNPDISNAGYHDNKVRMRQKSPNSIPQSQNPRRHSSHQTGDEHNYGNVMPMDVHNQSNAFLQTTNSSDHNNRYSVHSDQVRSDPVHERNDSNQSFTFDNLGGGVDQRTSSPQMDSRSHHLQQQRSNNRSGVGVSLTKDASALYAGSYATLPSHPQIDYKRSPKKTRPPQYPNQNPHDSRKLRNGQTKHSHKRSDSPLLYGTQNDIFDHDENTDQRRINIVNLNHERVMRNEFPLSSTSSEMSNSPSKENSYNQHHSQVISGKVNRSLNFQGVQPHSSDANLNRSPSKHNRSFDSSNVHNSSFDSDVDSTRHFMYGTQSSPDPKALRKRALDYTSEGNYQAFVGGIELKIKSGPSNNDLI
ncbi:uncharacterized protein LOC142348460 isoform X5 [Convolutriloba macropyga]|uniref:uncharacterized protein LOC142348460 isoform X5 n=1 Tax=Convolutriloba macropyga TaxID=536237 RepID=UPI003F51CF62